MISQNALERYRELVEIEAVEMDTLLALKLSSTLATAIQHGVGQSGRCMLMLKEDAVNSLKARAQFALGQMLRCLTAHAVPLSDDVVDQAITTVKTTIENQSDSVHRQLFASGAFRSSGLEGAQNQVQMDYLQVAPRLIGKISTEMKLAAAASSTVARTSNEARFTFNGPVALVQTGDGSQGSAVQYVNAEISQQIVNALDSLLVQLDSAENCQLPRRDELVDLVHDAKTEAQKPRPNSLKLGASLRGIAETTKFVGSLGPAYQVLKPLLSFLGVHLP